MAELTPTTALYEGREVEVIKLPNGDSVYMHRKMHGLQYRKLRSFVGRIVDAQVKHNDGDKLDSETLKKSLDIKIEMGDFYDEIVALFPFLCATVQLTDGRFIPATVDYFDSLPIQDADMVMGLLENVVNPYLGRGGQVGGAGGMDDAEKKS